MMVQRRKLFLVGIVAAILVPVALMEAAESANNQGERAKPATSKADAQPAAKKQEEASRGKRPLTATQGTPVLGVIIGKRIGIEAAEVERVWPGSPAEQAGLRAGDRITRVDDEEIKSPEALRVAVLGREPGDRVRLTVLRDGERHELKTRLGGADGLAGWSRKDALSESPKAPGWLGVRVAPGLSATQAGVIVTRVFSGSPADAAGLKKGDAILQVDKTRVEAAADLKVAIGGRHPGETVKLVVRRDDRRKTFEVELGSFAAWHAAFSQLTEEEIGQLVHELLTAPLSLVEELLPVEANWTDGRKEGLELPEVAVAALIPTKGNKARGVIELRQTKDGVCLTGKVTGLKPGLHGFHIHEYGDMRKPDGSAAGGHFNPGKTGHGGPQDKEHHAGDLGNIEANQDGVAQVDITAPWLKLHFVIGRSIVVHAGEDDLESQPSGDAGPRVAMGVIGIAEPASQQQARASDPE
jgi:superoxide dismutase, Cu-Zn family